MIIHILRDILILFRNIDHFSTIVQRNTREMKNSLAFKENRFRMCYIHKLDARCYVTRDEKNTACDCPPFF